MKKTLADGTQIEPEATAQHYTAPATKYPVTYKFHDAGGQYASVIWQAGAPAAWVGQQNWVPFTLLKGS